MIELPRGAKAHFASDFHLSLATPSLSDRFERWMASIAQPGHLIFLLGDLFEAWIGDDHLDDVAKRFITACKSATGVGTKIYLMQGNRDFLMGDTFADLCGAELLPDPEFLRVASRTIVLTHGDSFCTDDKSYMQFKSQSRQIKWQEAFLSKPIEERLAIAAHIRGESKKQSQAKEPDIMDVNRQAVSKTYDGQWPEGYYVGKTDVIIHGHTHRCAVHIDQTNKDAAHFGEPVGILAHGMRIVLPDWREPSYDVAAAGGHLTLDHQGNYTLQQWK